MNSRRGFTLLELAVVLVIMALALAVTAPAIASWRSPRPLDAALASFVAALHLARERAVSTGTQAVFVTDPVTARFWLTPRDTSFVLALPEGCALLGPARTVMFFAAEGPAHGTLPSVVCGGESARVDVDPLTGSIHAEPAR
jgi:general secretion pathway protein H